MGAAATRRKGEEKATGAAFPLARPDHGRISAGTGTRLRFGLDPLIGLIPGLGDTASAIVSAMTLIYAARCGLPKILLVRMSANILINEVVGIIPGIGDAFSFWFKSNSRNYELLQRHWGAPRRKRTSDWIFVGTILGLLGLIVGIGLVVSFFVLQQVANLFRHP